MATYNYSEEQNVAAGGDWHVNVVSLNDTNSTELTVRWPAAAVSVTYARSKMIALAAALTVLIIFIILLIIFTVMGNLLVCVALFRYRALRTISNCLIGNLAASDFLLAVTVLPFSATNE